MFSGLTKINTPATRSFSHAITFGIDLAVFTNIVQFAITKTNKSRLSKPFLPKWGPVICLTFATALVMADLVRHLANDAWGTACTDLPDGKAIQICDTGKTNCDSPVDHDYSKYCYSRDVMNEFQPGYEGFPHLTVYGWVFTVFCTWSGYLLLFVGIFWIINFPQKMAAKWRQVRGTRRRVVNAPRNSA